MRRFAVVVAIACAACSSPERPLPTLLPAPVLPERGRVVDLSHPFAEGMPALPGDAPFVSRTTATIDHDGVFENRIELSEHCGTHVDAPRRFAANGADVADIAAERLIVPAVVIDISARAATDPDAMVGVDDVLAFESMHGPIDGGSVVLMRSDWDRFWDEPELYVNLAADGDLHFPGFSPEAAAFLARERHVAGLGVDTPSVDTGIATDLEAHKAVLAAGGFVVENLAKLSRLPPRGATLIVAPLAILGGSGAPARVLAIVP